MSKYLVTAAAGGVLLAFSAASASAAYACNGNVCWIVKEKYSYPADSKIIVREEILEAKRRHHHPRAQGRPGILCRQRMADLVATTTAQGGRLTGRPPSFSLLKKSESSTRSSARTSRCMWLRLKLSELAKPNLEGQPLKPQRSASRARRSSDPLMSALGGGNRSTDCVPELEALSPVLGGGPRAERRLELTKDPRVRCQYPDFTSAFGGHSGMARPATGHVLVANAPM